MKAKKAIELSLGIYLIYWKSGGSSVASIYQTWDGIRMIAPANWVHPSPIIRIHKHIKKAHLILA